MTKAKTYSAIPAHFLPGSTTDSTLSCLYGISPLWTHPGYVATVSSPEYAGCCSWQLLPAVPAEALCRTGRTGASPLASQEGTTQKQKNPIKLSVKKKERRKSLFSSN